MVFPWQAMRHRLSCLPGMTILQMNDIESFKKESRPEG
jgi:hypothetical protein